MSGGEGAAGPSGAGVGVDLTLAEVAAATGGSVVRGDGAARVAGASIDTRTLGGGELFVAIAGERFDGHSFAARAAGGGAAALLVHSAPDELGELPDETPVVRVDDTRAALADLARAWRERVAPTVLGLTGSMGKTTTKELCAAVLAEHGPTHKTRGNFNNDIGLPLTLLAMPADSTYLVAEMGMNAPGEIATLAAIALPDVGLVTNVAPVHLEGLGSIEAIAAAKGELLRALPDDGAHWGVIPDDGALLREHAAHLRPERLLTFGETAAAQIRLLEVRPLGERGSALRLRLPALDQTETTLELELPLVGRHNARNAAAAAAAAVALGIPPAAIAAGLARRPELGHRSTIRDIAGWRVLDDCYNASPRAVEAALQTVCDLARDAEVPAVAVLGEMKELGPSAAELHREVGRFAATQPLAALFVVGAAAAAIAEGARAAGAAYDVYTVDEPAEAAAQLAARTARGWLLVKASRGAALERVIEGLKSTAAASDTAYS